MMGGLLLMSIVSGQVISRRGRYRAFPIAGTAVMTVGLLRSRAWTWTRAALASSLSLLVLGLGLGMAMQVLILAVQNAVDYEVLGAATSAVTMLRGVGGSIGTAVFGAIFSSRLASGLSDALPAAGGRNIADGARLTGAQPDRLPAAARATYDHAFVQRAAARLPGRGGGGAAGLRSARLLEERPCARPPRPAAAWRTAWPHRARRTRWPRSSARSAC